MKAPHTFSSKRFGKPQIMTDESTMKLTDFDYLIGDHHLQMVKAALPYVNVTEQRLLSVFVKLRELQRTISLFHEDQVAAMGICSLNESQKGSPLEMMKAIKPYGNTQEQDFIDMICNFLQGPRMGGQYPDIVAAQSVPGDMIPDNPLSATIPDGNHSPGSSLYHDKFSDNGTHTSPAFPNQTSNDSAFTSQTNQDFSSDSVSDETVSNVAASASESFETPAFHIPAAAVHTMRSPLEQLKNFLPPEQQARLEQATFLIQALQQFT